MIKKCTTNHIIVAALLYYRATIVLSSLSLPQYLSLPQKGGGARGREREMIKVERFLCNWNRTSKSIRKRGTKRELHNSDVGLIKSR